MVVGVGFGLVGGAHVAGVQSGRQVHLNHHWLRVFQGRPLFCSQVFALLHQLSVGGVLARLLQAGLGVVAFALRPDRVVRLQIRLVRNHVLRDSRLVVLVSLQVPVLLRLRLSSILLVLAVGHKVLQINAVSRQRSSLSVCQYLLLTALLRVAGPQNMALSHNSLLCRRQLNEGSALLTRHGANSWVTRTERPCFLGGGRLRRLALVSNPHFGARLSRVLMVRVAARSLLLTRGTGLQTQVR